MPTRRASRPRARTRAKRRPKDRKTAKSIPTFHSGRRNGGSRGGAPLPFTEVRTQGVAACRVDHVQLRGKQKNADWVSVDFLKISDTLSQIKSYPRYLDTSSDYLLSHDDARHGTGRPREADPARLSQIYINHKNYQFTTKSRFSITPKYRQKSIDAIINLFLFKEA
ncbi:hypothetical protein CBA19CS91_21810 [Paraburkholderia hospita]|nr:hypothetical protein CBA19CS91_21810 [Paraburkholderia hospita]